MICFEHPIESKDDSLYLLIVTTYCIFTRNHLKFHG